MHRDKGPGRAAAVGVNDTPAVYVLTFVWDVAAGKVTYDMHWPALSWGGPIFSWK